MIAPGSYRHYKGGLYTVLGLVLNTTHSAGDSPMVLYVSEAGKFVRDLAEFTEEIEWPDGVRRPRWVHEEA